MLGQKKVDIVMVAPGQWFYLAVLLVVLGLLLSRDPKGLNILGAVALFVGAGLSLFVGHKLVKASVASIGIKTTNRPHKDPSTGRFEQPALGNLSEW